MPGGVKRCCFYNCKNYLCVGYKKFRLFQFPSDIERRKIWAERTHNPAILKENIGKLFFKYLCEEHFEENQFYDARRNRLKLTAVPRITAAPEENIQAPEPIRGGKKVESKPDNTELAPTTLLSVSDAEEEKEEEVDNGAESIRQEPTQDQNTEKRRMGIDKTEICRVCGIQNFLRVSINKDTCFESFKDITVAQMVNKHLPLEIHTDDEFPLYICLNCINALNNWHDLYVTCAAVDKALKIAFSEDNEKDLSKAVPSGQNSSRLVVSHDDGESRSRLTLNVPEKDLQAHAADLDCQDTQKLNFEVEFENLDEQQMHVEGETLFCKKCRFCGALFTTLSDYKIHFDICKESSAICETCGKFISKRRLFRQHYRQHHRIVNVLCHLCGESLNICQLYKHRQKHHNIVHIPCFGCCSIYSSKHIYKKHMKLHEQGKIKLKFQVEPTVKEGNTIFECPVCSENFSDKFSLIKHLIQPKSLKCVQCRVPLKSEKGQLFHKCKEYHCKYCFKSFFVNVSLKNHERLHTGEKPFKCHVCERVFRTRYQRSIHRRVHKPPTYECLRQL